MRSGADCSGGSSSGGATMRSGAGSSGSVSGASLLGGDADALPPPLTFGDRFVLERIPLFCCLRLLTKCKIRNYVRYQNFTGHFNSMKEGRILTRIGRDLPFCDFERSRDDRNESDIIFSKSI